MQRRQAAPNLSPPHGQPERSRSGKCQTIDLTISCHVQRPANPKAQAPLARQPTVKSEVTVRVYSTTADNSRRPNDHRHTINAADKDQIHFRKPRCTTTKAHIMSHSHPGQQKNQRSIQNRQNQDPLQNFKCTETQTAKREEKAAVTLTSSATLGVKVFTSTSSCYVFRSTSSCFVFGSTLHASSSGPRPHATSSVLTTIISLITAHGVTSLQGKN